MPMVVKHEKLVVLRNDARAELFRLTNQLLDTKKNSPFQKLFTCHEKQQRIFEWFFLSTCTLKQFVQNKDVVKVNCNNITSGRTGASGGLKILKKKEAFFFFFSCTNFFRCI